MKSRKQTADVGDRLRQCDVFNANGCRSCQLDTSSLVAPPASEPRKGEGVESSPNHGAAL
jgi:hypothetical protein